MDKLEQSQHVINLIKIRSYYEDIKPPLFISGTVNKDKRLDECINKIKELESEIDYEVSSLLNGNISDL